MSGTRISSTTTRRPPGGLRKGDRRREAILEAVERLLRERPISELSVESIAEASGISRSGFYFYFESKYAALAEALGGLFEEMTAAAGDFFVGSEDPPRVYVPRALAGIAELWDRHEALMVGLFEASASDPGARAVWEAWLDRFVGAITARVEVERAEGRAPGGPPAATLSRVLLLMNERVLYDATRRGVSPAGIRDIVDALTAVWLAAVWGELPGQS
jgi:TetR/AcrR family transcriptional regulator, ethionamide resistance regulator